MAVEHARYDRLGQTLFDLVPESATKTLLYVEFGDGVIGPSIFYESDGSVYQVFCTNEVFDDLRRLQDIFGPTVHTMEFEMVGERFTTHFTYGDGSIDFEGEEARCDAALIKSFGHTNTINPSR